MCWVLNWQLWDSRSKLKKEATGYSPHVYFEPGLCWNEPISILGYRGSSLDLFMVTQTHFQWWFQGRKWIVKKLLHFYEIYQPSKKGHTNFGTPRSLEPFLVGFEQKSFCQNVFYNNQVGQPRNFYQNSSTLIKMRGKFPKLSMEIYNTGGKWPCPPVLNFKVLPFSQMWSDFDEIRYQVSFQWVENRVRISRL